MESCDVFIVGAGAAGLTAARAAAEGGCSVLLADRNDRPGGILRQCIHRGFGAEKTGPEYIAQLLCGFPEAVRFLGNTTVLSVDESRRAVLSSADYGLKEIRFRQMILASGCREIPFGSLGIAGTRPEGIYTAGQVQADMNLHGRIPEGPAVVLGSGDVGLVMAWQLLEAGVEIRALVEKKEKCGGLPRNRKRLEGRALPLRCGCEVSRVFGEKRIEGVRLRNVQTGEEEFLPCRTLIVAAGMQPERDLARGLEDREWLHLCGNCARIHALVENVIQDGLRAGTAACEKLRGSI